MPLPVMLLSGPSHSGKTALARLLAEDVLRRPVHLVRLIPARDGHTNAIDRFPVEPAASGPVPWASCHQAKYTADRVFETIPEALRAVRKIDRRGFTVVEADADPAVRHAYPYDYRVFLMPAPSSVQEVFRPPADAASALRQVMQDTAAFASEIFGLFEADSLDDSAGVRHYRPPMPAATTSDTHDDTSTPVPARCDDSSAPKLDSYAGLFLPPPLSHPSPPMETLDIGEAQLRQFLSSPLGVEIASRIQLQPDYHALVEADVIIINTGGQLLGEPFMACINRLEKLLTRVRHDTRRHSVLYWGDLANPNDPARGQLIDRLVQLIRV